MCKFMLHNVNGIPGCEMLVDLGLPAFGSVTQQRVCDMQWGDLDDAYNNLRICATKLVGKLCYMMQLHFELLYLCIFCVGQTKLYCHLSTY